MAAATYRSLNVSDPKTAVAKAGLQAIITAVELGFRSLILEGDGRTVINKINDSSTHRSSIAIIIQKIT